MNGDQAEDLDATVRWLVEPAIEGLARRLSTVVGLAPAEQAVVADAAKRALYLSVRAKVSRMLLVELNAARITGALAAADSAGRWAEFVDLAARPEFWTALTEHYPALLDRLNTVVDNRCGAVVTLAERFGADRAELALGELTRIDLDAGDSHQGGHTVALLRGTAGTIVYKPRPVDIDRLLATFLAEVFGDDDHRIRVPGVLVRDGYGWAEFVEHRYCAGETELVTFHRNLGAWLAVARVLAGSDLHRENLIACGPVPVVVDCETLFTPHRQAPPSGLGQAVDRAAGLLRGSVLRCGLLPSRGVALGWRGVDSSGIGALPGQQPANPVPTILDAGTDVARLGFRLGELAAEGNHPSPDPVLARYWGHVIDGFEAANTRLEDLDATGRLEGLLAPFAGAPVRQVLRDTETYVELTKMLWHPASLHGQRAAETRVADLLARQATLAPSAPGDRAVIAAEIADLLVGEVPMFTTTASDGRLTGPGGIGWGAPADLVAGALRHWRTSELDNERLVIRAALVSAYLNEAPPADPVRMTPGPGPADRLETRRRSLLTGLIGQLRDTAIRAGDGTVTWIAPRLDSTGWSVVPLGLDVYSGGSGVAILLAAYCREVTKGRADAVDGAEDLLADMVRTVRLAQDKAEEERHDGILRRPDTPGGYVGISSQVWSWLVLDGLGAGGPDAVARAEALAALLPEAVAEDEALDVLLGTAGALVPLLALAERTGSARWSELAVEIGDRLVDAVSTKPDGTLCWQTRKWPTGLGGFAHGTTGISWALARLGLATGLDRFAWIASGGFAFEDALWLPGSVGWLDLREPDAEDPVVPAAWCHGAAGIGLASADLLRRGDERHRSVVQRAAEASWAHGFGWNHTLCHGDTGAWELVDAALRLGCAPSGVDAAALDARVVDSVEQYGAVSGMARAVYQPGLVAGLGGVAYELLRLNRDSDLPSMLLQET